MTKLSVNINKIATIRNARGGNNPNLFQIAIDAEKFGAQGITVHPRPDERHITKQDVFELKKVVNTELNIEGYPDDRFMELVEAIRPEQATLVPDPPDVLTSNAGWDTVGRANELKPIISKLKTLGIRTSIFVEPNITMVKGASEIGTDRIELYTEMYANSYHQNKKDGIAPYIKAAKVAHDIGLGVNAGHDLDLDNLQYFNKNIPFLDEVSIGHALICDALYFGLETTIQRYLQELK
jgi:pyridoxine 5-phosphate synthase